MVYVIGGSLFVGVVFLKLDPLMALVIGGLAYLAYKKVMLGRMLETLEYWKQKEFDLKEEMAANKETEKQRRVRIRETRAAHRTKVVRTSKQARLMDKFFTLADRKNLKALPIEARAILFRQLGLKPEMVEKWLVLSDAELERRKLGIDDLD